MRWLPPRRENLDARPAPQKTRAMSNMESEAWSGTEPLQGPVRVKPYYGVMWPEKREKRTGVREDQWQILERAFKDLSRRSTDGKIEIRPTLCSLLQVPPPSSPLRPLQPFPPLFRLSPSLPLPASLDRGSSHKERCKVLNLGRYTGGRAEGGLVLGSNCHII